jgi:hypothetical protein
MKKVFFIIAISFSLIAFSNTKAQIGDRTNDIWNIAQTPDGGVVAIQWQFSLLADTTSVYYSPQFSIPSGYEYDVVLNKAATCLIKQTAKTLAIKGAWTLQGLYGGTTDTSNVKLLRLGTGGAQTALDTSFTFQFSKTAPVYRIKYLPTTGSGRVVTNKIFIYLTKRYDTYSPISPKK